jgi:hypothetical protein
MPPESDDDLAYDIVEPPPGTPMSETAWRAMHGPIEAARMRYELTGNALFAWDGWRHARALQALTPPRGVREVPIPDWILDYLDGCAARLLDSRTPENLPAALGLAMGRGGPAAMTRRRTLFDHLAIASRVEDLLDKAWLEGEKLTVHKATKIVAEQLGVELRTAKRAVREARLQWVQWIARWVKNSPSF